MKIIKYTILSLITAVILDAVFVKAYDSPYIVLVSDALVGNNEYDRGTFTKTHGSDVHQSYENRYSGTATTSNCVKCKIKTTLYGRIDLGGGIYTNLVSNSPVTKMGEVAHFNNSADLAGDYTLKLQRYDWTILKTYHTGVWYLNVEY